MLEIYLVLHLLLNSNKPLATFYALLVVVDLKNKMGRFYENIHSSYSIGIIQMADTYNIHFYFYVCSGDAVYVNASSV